jgi:hypothetical protein
MFKEKSTEKLIEYIQSLPNTEQKLIVERISKIKSAAKIKRTAKTGLSSLKGRVAKTSNAAINRQIKTIRGESQKDT